MRAPTTAISTAMERPALRHTSSPCTGSWLIQQTGTVSSADGTYRWTGSIAMDTAGNMALGSHVSTDGLSPHPAVFPGVRLIGRLAGDPAGQMTTPEVHLVDGTISARGPRWGDYAAMRVDPADGCTFLYPTAIHHRRPARLRPL